MSVVTVTVRSQGRAVSQALALLAVDVRCELNRIPSAMLLYADGNAAERKFEASDSGQFSLGAEVQILARHEGRESTDNLLFKGLVVRHAIEADARGSVLRVELRDKAIQLTRPRHSTVFTDKKDSELISQLAGDARLEVEVSDTQVKHPVLVQYDSSDWDMLLSRADASGLVVSLLNGKLLATAAHVSGSAARVLRYGLDADLLSLEFEADALAGSGPGVSIKAQGWQPADQAMASASGDAPPAVQQGSGNFSAARAAQALHFGPATLSLQAGLDEPELKAWASAQARRAQLSLLRGRASITGDGKLKLLDLAKIDGGAQAFQGKALITGLCHRIDTGGWTTDLQFGLSPRPFHAEPGISAPAAAGLLPAVGGLQIGVVSALADDPKGEYRVQVKLPGFGAEGDTVWARLAQASAGKARGLCFRPEVGDEVVLGFFNQDPRLPVVLGAMHGSKNNPPEAVSDTSDKNLLSGWVSRTGVSIAISDDDKPKLTLMTPAKQQVVLDDDGQLIQLSDQHGNTITMDKNGITLKSAKDFKVEASGKVEIKGSKVDLQ